MPRKTTIVIIYLLYFYYKLSLKSRDISSIWKYAKKKISKFENKQNS